MIVDIHAHYWGKGFIPQAFHKETAENWAKKVPGRTPDMILSKIEEGLVDPDGKMYIENMDRAGIDTTFINMSDWGYWTGEEPETTLEEQIAFYSGLQEKYPGRLFSFAFADPRRENSLELFQKAISKYGLKGLGEFTTKNLYPYDEIVIPLFTICIDLDVPVFFHTRAGGGTKLTGSDYTLQNNAHPKHLERILAVYPDLKVIMGHSGYPNWWEVAASVARGHPNCYLDLSNWNNDRTNLANIIPKIACMRDMVGADHICFGTDHQSGRRFSGDRSWLPEWVDFFKRLPETAKTYGYQFTEEEVSLILGGNAQRIFKL